MTACHTVIRDLLAIESPTFSEERISAHIVDLLKPLGPEYLHIDRDGVVATFGKDKSKPVLAVIGHTDVVPKHFEPYQDGDKLYGAGASDMKGGLGCCLALVLNHLDAILKKYSLVFVAYTKEEGTGIEENGLYGLLKSCPQVFDTIDSAIVAEPTDNTIQLGCVGSLHAQVDILGKEAHSARPWHGDNALYKSIRFLEYFAGLKPETVTIKDCDYKEVLTVTQCQTESARTTVPGIASFNVNYRFGPNRSEESAWETLQKHIRAVGLGDEINVTLIDSVFAGQILSSELTDQIIQELGQPVQAKQAWTDVAQLSKAGIPCFNYGPGLQSQAHLSNEYIDLRLVDSYYQSLLTLLT